MTMCKPPPAFHSNGTEIPWDEEFQAFAEDCAVDKDGNCRVGADGPKSSLFATEAETTVRYLLTGRRWVPCV